MWQLKELLRFLFKQKKSKYLKWYSYLSLDFYIDYVFYTKPTDLMNFVCRMKGHPNGIVFYNPMGDEPDYSCKDCGEEIG
jgi:hypothetical protein